MIFLIMLHWTIFGGLITAGGFSDCLAMATALTPGSASRCMSGRRASGREGTSKTRCIRESEVVEGKHPNSGRGIDGWLQRWPRPAEVLWGRPYGPCAAGELLSCLPLSSTVLLVRRL